MRAAFLVPAAVLVVVLLAAGGVYTSSRAPAMAPISTDTLPAFEPSVVARGRALAAIGNCQGCHAAPGRGDYAGGRAVPTPFGAIYAANITPDPGAGIGRWSEAAFRRAMRRGVDREGRQLYPAFPYPHYTYLTDADVAALYAFVMTRIPVRNAVAASPLPFPLDERWIVAGWKLLFFRPAPLPSGEGRGPAWQRGAYLTAGLGHCGDCHTPRNALGGEQTGRALSGGQSEGWDAPALDAASLAPVPWTAEELFTYLRYGAHPLHGAAAGPMALVTRDLRDAAEDDVRDMALYIASGMAAGRGGEKAGRPPASPAPLTGSKLAARDSPSAEVLFSGACERCHHEGSRLVPPEGIDLARSTALSLPRPGNALRIILGGIAPAPGQAGPSMPPFAGSFTDAQLSALLSYLRARFSGRGPWRHIDRSVRVVQRERGAGAP